MTTTGVPKVLAPDSALWPGALAVLCSTSLGGCFEEQSSDPGSQERSAYYPSGTAGSESGPEGGATASGATDTTAADTSSTEESGSTAAADSTATESTGDAGNSSSDGTTSDATTGSSSDTGDTAESSGTTGPDCSEGETLCNGGCVDTQSSAEHCGACDDACQGANSCLDGTCLPPCGESFEVPEACMSSGDFADTPCDRMTDRKDLASPPEVSSVELDCTKSPFPDYCVPQGDSGCGNVDGCVHEVWIRFDFGARRQLSGARLLSDWWNKRPTEWEVWSTDAPDGRPDAGANLVFRALGQPAPWQCVDNDPCGPEVPELCCPNGATEQMNVPPAFAKFDVGSWSPSAARYWFLRVPSSQEGTQLVLHEIEWQSPRCG